MYEPKLTMNDNKEEKSEWLFDAILGASSLGDSFYNERMKIGGNDQNIAHSRWLYERDFLNWALWTTLYNQSWVFRNAVDKKSDATVSDIEIESEANPTEINNVLAKYEYYKTDLKYLMRQAMIYGGAAAMMLIEGFTGESQLAEAIDITTIPKDAKLSLYTRDRWNGLAWEGTAGLEALGTKDFMKHKYYIFQLTGDTGQSISNGIKVHHANALRCGNRPPTKYTSYQLAGWDLPEGHHVIEELTRDETTRASVASLISKSLIEVLKMPGIRGLFSGISGDLGDSNTSVSSKKELQGRIKAVTDYRNFNNLSFMDKEDEYSQFQFNGFSGLADIMEQNRRMVAGAVEIPEMVLYGSTDIKGLLFTKEGATAPEIEVYEQILNNKRDAVLRPMMDKFLPILWRIANGTDMPEGTTYHFLPTFKESQTAKIERAGMIISSIERLVGIGVFSPRDAGVEVKQFSKQTGFGTNLTDDLINKLSDLVVNPNDKKPGGGDVKTDTTNNAIEETKTPLNKQHDVNKVNKPKYKFEKRGGKR